MGEIGQHPPVLFLLAAFSRRDEALAWGKARAVERFGPLALESPAFDFSDTQYYKPTMGGPLLKRFWAFQRPIDPGDLVKIKHLTNDWEQEAASAVQAGAGGNLIANPGTESRPLNLDPGYLTLAKLVLASTKDHAHRIYLNQGVFAEVTLGYKHGAWQAHPWTFPDYRRPDYHQFFLECRKLVPRPAAEGA